VFFKKEIDYTGHYSVKMGMSMTSRGALKKYLQGEYKIFKLWDFLKIIHQLKCVFKDRICQNGRMTVPKHVIKDVFPKPRIPFQGLVIRSMEPHEKPMVKEFMLKHFYTKAPVPNALNLGQTWPKYQYLNDELGK
jgi:hypothetical protein